MQQLPKKCQRQLSRIKSVNVIEMGPQGRPDDPYDDVGTVVQNVLVR
jgi:hypothetical protein